MKNIVQLFLLFIASQSFAQTPFITTWQTTTANESITISTTGAGYNYDVDWGDGNSTTGYSNNATHVYDTSGIYQVSISGDFPRIYFNNAGDKNKIISIDQWGSQVLTSMFSAFNGCSNVGGQAIDIPNLSLVTSMVAMFNCAYSFNQDIGNWYVSSANTIKKLLY